MLDTVSDPNFPPQEKLSWARQDVEQKLFFPGGRHTRVNSWLTAFMALGCTIIFYAILLAVSDTEFAKMFTERGYVPYVIVFVSFWALSILVIKSRKIAYQRKALDIVVVPQDSEFVLTPATVDIVVERIYSVVDDPKNFILFNRIVIALANLRNLGRVSDVDDILRSQAESDESAMDTSYALVGGFVWAIPVLGFIGTVIGLSSAIGDFGAVLQSADDLEKIKLSLQDVTGGLSTAFQTTLEALVAALFIQMFLIYLRKNEEEFMDACSEYCVRNTVNRLRILPFERDPE